MPQTIPYDPALALANIIDDSVLNALEAVAKAEAPVNAAEEAFNSALLNLRSLAMTMSELSDMQLDVSEISKSVAEAEKAVLTTAAALGQARVKGLTDVEAAKKAAKAAFAAIHDYPESPVDYNKTQIKQMPLSADSLNMDAQYFSFDEEKQSAASHAATIKAYVSESTSFLGDKFSTQASTAAQSQVSKQHENHQLEGTLVITAACTHKQAAVLAPFVLDVDKAIRVWNDMKMQPLIKTDSVASMTKIAEQEGTSQEKKFHILSGATYGSSFVGMVHLLKTEDTSAEQSMISAAASLQEQMSVGSWFADEEGGFGVNATFSDDAKSMLSTQAISSHISLISMGSIPSIKSNEVQIGVKQFADFDPASMMGKLATLQNATAADQDSVQNAAENARTGGKMMAIRSTEIKSVMSGLSTVDDGKNKMLDINSLMTAFEDYVQKAIEGKVGVPITYYLKSITAAQLAQMWVAKYFPKRYVTSAGDDTGGGTGGGDTGGGSTGGGDTGGGDTGG